MKLWTILLALAVIGALPACGEDGPDPCEYHGGLQSEYARTAGDCTIHYTTWLQFIDPYRRYTKDLSIREIMLFEACISSGVVYGYDYVAWALAVEDAGVEVSDAALAACVAYQGDEGL